MLDKTKKDWFKSAVVYQIYPKSFQDTTGNGTGDLKGIIKRLDYLENLGIDVIWLSPVFKSPQVDNGYDISDYKDIDSIYGSLDDMKELIHEGKKRNIGIMMDLVLNHSSNEHEWFKQAKSSRDNPYHDYYVWRDGTKDKAPNDMKACFGGSAWTFVDGINQYYFHQFAPEQPDLNWENPKLRREIYDMILFWIDLGVDGFRLDVIDQIAKEPDKKITNNGPKLHEFLRELSRETFQKGCLITVGEAWGADIEKAKLYSNPDGSELSMVFQFQHVLLDRESEKWDTKPLSLTALKENMSAWQTGLHNKGWNSLFLDNHDLPRIVSRWGNDKKYRVQSAKMLAAMLHGMQGTPYIYQGEELGMTNIKLDISDYKDLEIINMYNERKQKGYKHEDIMQSIYASGRDNARTPMQWDSSENAGFTNSEPWIKVNPNYKEINAENALNDKDSIFYFYKKLISLRKEYKIFVDGDFTLLEPEHEKLFIYSRKLDNNEMLVLCNFGDEETEYKLPEKWLNAKVLIQNYSGINPELLRPWECLILYRSEII